MKKKNLIVMTSIGPLPYEVAVKLKDNLDTALKEENLIESECAIKAYIIERLAAKKKWNVDNMRKYLNTLLSISPVAVFGILIKEAALLLDEQHPGTINSSKEIYIISTLDGKVHKVEGKIKSFRNFAAFRTKEDAEFTSWVFRDELKTLFKSGKSKD